MANTLGQELDQRITGLRERVGTLAARRKEREGIEACRNAAETELAALALAARIERVGTALSKLGA